MISRMTADRMGSSRAGVLLTVALVATSLSCSSPPPPATAPAPTTGMLAGWQLTLPEAGPNGHAATVKPARLTPPWLTDDGSGNLVFWAPVNGVTTPNSEHARTELDSLTDFRAGTGRHVLTASVAVSQVPKEVPEVIIGQIHGAADISSVPFVMLFYAGGAVKVVVKQEQSGTAGTDYPLLTDVPLNARFDYGITDNGDGSLTFTASYGGQTASASGPVPAAFAGASVRFQAGAYQQASSTQGAAPADDGARVTFYALSTEGGSAPATG
jgi:hypothetical protein